METRTILVSVLFLHPETNEFKMIPNIVCVQGNDAYIQSEECHSILSSLTQRISPDVDHEYVPVLTAVREIYQEDMENMSKTARVRGSEAEVFYFNTAEEEE